MRDATPTPMYLARCATLSLSYCEMCGACFCAQETPVSLTCRFIMFSESTNRIYSRFFEYLRRYRASSYIVVCPTDAVPARSLTQVCPHLTQSDSFLPAFDSV